jgi:ubiquinone/menaquinone biosynthesis C-methylase UbiE/DNA-binding transcriptional ArsR family regulator
MKRLGLADIVEQLRAAGESTRTRILWLLGRGELSVGELAQVLGQSQPRLSRHLKFLTVAGLVERLPEGAWVFYRLPSEGPARALLGLLMDGLDPDDAVLRRDFVRLEEIKAARAQAATDYFSRVADDWDRLRAMQFSEAGLEQAVLDAAGPGPFELAVDFGTGTGRMLSLLGPRAKRVEGIDLNHHMLTVARANLREAGVENAAVRHGDATAAPYQDGVADLVVIHQVLHFLDDPGRALTEAGRVLRPGGRLVVVDFAPHTLERLRSDFSHRHLGVADADFRGWAARAGLETESAAEFESPSDVEGVTVVVWAAVKRAAARKGRAA